MLNQANERVDVILSKTHLKVLSDSADDGHASARQSLDILQESGFLIQAVPEELGGLGLSEHEVLDQLKDIATHTPHLAKAVREHIAWTGIAAERWNRGDRSLEWILRDACDGEVFANGFNKITQQPTSFTFDSADSGCCLNGIAWVNYPAWLWSRLIAYEINESNNEVEFAFINRQSNGLTVETNGKILLDAVFVPDKYMIRLDLVPAYDDKPANVII